MDVFVSEVLLHRFSRVISVMLGDVECEHEGRPFFGGSVCFAEDEYSKYLFSALLTP